MASIAEAVDPTDAQSSTSEEPVWVESDVASELESFTAKFQKAAREQQEELQRKRAEMEAAHASALMEAVATARCQAIEEAAVSFASERSDDVAKAVAAAVAAAEQKFEEQRLADKALTDETINMLKAERHDALLAASSKIRTVEEAAAASLTAVEEAMTERAREAQQTAVMGAITETSIRLKLEHQRCMATALAEARLEVC